VRAIAGADRHQGGRVLVEGREVRFRSPADAIAAGVVLAPEDRKRDGLLAGMSVRANLSLAALRSVARHGWILADAEREVAMRWIRELDIRTPSPEQLAKNLSGGNQQKVVLAKWLHTAPKVLLLDEPTRGIDVGAKAEIYELMRRLAERGLALVMVSSELPEVLGMSDRIAVMHEGRLAAVLPRSEATEERVMHFATGQDRDRGVPS